MLKIVLLTGNAPLRKSGLVQVLAKHCRKGRQAFVQGKLQTREWQVREGRDRTTTEVLIAPGGHVSFLDRANASAPADADPSGAATHNTRRWQRRPHYRRASTARFRWKAKSNASWVFTAGSLEERVLHLRFNCRRVLGLQRSTIMVRWRSLQPWHMSIPLGTKTGNQFSLAPNAAVRSVRCSVPAATSPSYP